jgi:hypothetical protein
VEGASVLGGRIRPKKIIFKKEKKKRRGQRGRKNKQRRCID